MPTTTQINGHHSSDGESVVNSRSNSHGVTINGESHLQKSSLAAHQEYQVKVTHKCLDDLTVINGDVLSKSESLKSFLDFLDTDRLKWMPHRGDRWDKILRWAEYFAIQVSRYEESVRAFIFNSLETAKAMWASCRILIQMGRQHAQALEKIIGVFYRMGLAMSSILRNYSLFTISDATKQQLVSTYSDLVEIVTEITKNYQRKLRKTPSLSANDLHDVLGSRIDRFFFHRDQISDEMWVCELERNQDSPNLITGFRSIRKWLAPQDRTLRLLSSDTMNSRSSRAEFTCEWFQDHLLDFSTSKEDLLLITGASGSGKSVLSGWIAERLERTLNGKTFFVNSININPTVAAHCTSLSVAKQLLLQSLEQNLGNFSLYKLLATALDLSTRGSSADEIEEVIWNAFDKALDTDDNTMIVINGLNYITGGADTQLKFLERVHEISKKHRHTKCIVLTQSLDKARVQRFKIESNHTHQDLSRYINSSLNSHQHFRDRKEAERHSIVHRIANHVQGNFTWAEYIIQLLESEKTHKEYSHTLDHLPKSVHETVNVLISHVDFTVLETKLTLSWLLAAARPLTLQEIEALLDSDVVENKRSKSRINIHQHIWQTCGPLVVVRDGVVRFRHISVQEELKKPSKAGKSLLKLDDAHRDLTYRCLWYASNRLTSSTDCSMDLPELSSIDRMFQKHHLLEYTVRYWTKHFSSSPMYRKNGKHEITVDFKNIFSGSVLFAQMERICWESQSSISEALTMHHLAVNVRKFVFTEHHETVLQSLITVATTYEKILLTTKASEYYFEISKLSRSVLDAYSDITITCAQAFLKCVKSITITKRTEIVTRKEEILQILINAHEHHHGHASEEVIKYKKILAELYTDIHETTLAIEMYKEVYEACVERYGEFHSETTTVSRGLVVVLQREARYEDVLVYVRTSFTAAERTMDIADVRRIAITLHLIEIYETHQEFVEAEELLIALWRKISVACHTRHLVEIHERKIEITLAYVRFLRRHARYQEAENILRGLWIEYEHEDIQSEGLIIWIKSIGEELNELRILDVAVRVFTTVWNFFKRIRKAHTAEAVSVAITLARITIDIHSEESSTEVTTYSVDTILKEVHETTMTTITTTKITTSTIHTCKTLTSFYVSRKQWSEVIKICHEVLSRLWISVISDHDTVDLPGEHAHEAIDMVIRMAHCHFHEHRVEKAEKLLLYVFRAAKTKLSIQDHLVSKTVEELIKFYEKIEKSHKAITVYRELLHEYSYSLGKTHSLTIKVLYHLGDLCVRHKEKGADGYYLEIYESLVIDSEICHHDALDAAFALVKLYETERRWIAAQNIYACLWRTVLRRTKEYNFTADRVDGIYRRYFQILEKETKVTYVVLRQITIEFRNICVEVFGARSEVSLKAILRLAEINERSEEHVHEAIKIYEETFRETQITTQTTTITKIVLEARTRLSRLYVVHSSSSVTFVSKSLTLFTEQFENLRIHFGCSHEKTLTLLEELVVFYKTQKDQKLVSSITRLLQSTVIEIITKERDSRRLFDSSIRIARIYLAQGYVDEALNLITELRRQIVSRDMRFSKTCGFRLDQHADRRCFVFIATFEEVLKGTKVVNFSEIMAEFLTENIMYDAYSRALSQHARFETIMVHGARLRYFRRSKYSDANDSKIDDELFEAFQGQMGVSIRTNRLCRYFFGILLEETGKSQHDVNLVRSGCSSGATTVHALLQQSKFQDALDLASCVWQFTKSHSGYRDQENISDGFKIALYIIGRGAKECPANDQKLRQQMMNLSRAFVEDILKASREMNVNFTKTPVGELNELVSLLGEQKNYSDLEWILGQLWESRYSQSGWHESTTLYIGRRLAEVRFIHGHHDSAIHLLEDICYNVRRVFGPLAKITVQMFTLLSEFYTNNEQHQKAMGVHEMILRQEINDDYDDTSAEEASHNARTHLELLKRAHQRLGGWDKEKDVYVDLYDGVVSMFHGKQEFGEVQPIHKWSNKGADGMGCYKEPVSWGFLGMEKEKRHQNWRKRISIQRYDSDYKREQRVSSLHTVVES